MADSAAENMPFLHDTDIEADLNEGNLSNNPSRLDRFRRRLRKLLESHWAHILVFALVLIDLTCVLTEIIVTFLETPECDEQGKPHVGGGEPVWLETLTAISLTILWVFVAEHLLRLFAFGICYYIRKPLHLFDFLVVVGSLVAEMVLKGKAREVAGLLIVLRCWRLVRIIDGVAEAVSSKKDEQIADLREEVKRLKNEAAQLRQRLGRLNGDGSQNTLDGHADTSGE
ncbi:uncharacterized protein SPPG_03022 [Spizellomyces punctatus DAOM BR117]|uniref:Voltage-gated hydrogen channel 1 n=1 Tax=Spizellomyces punctatus (strain DAOM BR117) TaxID=645134 RepID=A0A0L0HNR0_SPIPD|nr:uncharacterized protein SPPG_03022 [Spizellomyces punctatus DAOM BR117]KND02565.1 hypothetical protein SPPG_03022 [Spizellomyces punctatus DAOM BR117]|eukprot:XP_016610604.1 hypothetical protein SPPG_03022 [Spizellomyces punctatus DAOM BR117]